MKVRTETFATARLVLPEGRLDFAAAPHFQQHLEAAIGKRGDAPAAVLVDCAALEYVSSAGLRIFLIAARTAQRAGVAFALSALTPAVREVFEFSGFSRMIEVHPDRHSALAVLVPPAAAASGQRAAALNEVAQLAELTRFLQAFWAAERLPADAALAFELALEEVFMNVVMHGGAPGSVRVEVLLERVGPQLRMTIEDGGRPFDPLSLPPPDLTLSLEERPIGGQGVFLMRQMMDSVTYRRVGERNQLVMSRRIDK